MRHITKKLSHSSKLATLSKAHSERQPTTAEEATKLWNNLDNKSDILNLLLFEQYGLCCYSEIRADELGWGCHIEHIENKSQNPVKTFDYFNLLASAISSDDLSKIVNVNVFGGHSTGKRGIPNPVDMNIFISPLQIDCQGFFVYQSDGKVTPNPNLTIDEQEKAQFTIDVLNLNSPELTTRREKLWAELSDNLQNHLDDLSDISYWIEIELLPRKRKLESFFSLKRQFFAGLAEQTLAHYKNEELL